METSDTAGQKKPAIMAREPDATMQPTLQDNQLMSKHRLLGDVFMARAGKGPRKACSYRAEEGTADAPKLAFAA
jgi:hypothetical protein